MYTYNVINSFAKHILSHSIICIFKKNLLLFCNCGWKMSMFFTLFMFQSDFVFHLFLFMRFDMISCNIIDGAISLWFCGFRSFIHWILISFRIFRAVCEAKPFTFLFFFANSRGFCVYQFFNSKEQQQQNYDRFNYLGCSCRRHQSLAAMTTPHIQWNIINVFHESNVFICNNREICVLYNTISNTNRQQPLGSNLLSFRFRWNLLLKISFFGSLVRVFIVYIHTLCQRWCDQWMLLLLWLLLFSFKKKWWKEKLWRKQSCSCTSCCVHLKIIKKNAWIACIIPTEWCSPIPIQRTDRVYMMLFLGFCCGCCKIQMQTKLAGCFIQDATY